MIIKIIIITMIILITMMMIIIIIIIIIIIKISIALHILNNTRSADRWWCMAGQTEIQGSFGQIQCFVTVCAHYA